MAVAAAPLKEPAVRSAVATMACAAAPASFEERLCLNTACSTAAAQMAGSQQCAARRSARCRT
eukprot:4461534-Pleurochrysis_carterae.AAC.1